MKVTYLRHPTSRVGLIIRRDELQDGEIGRLTMPSYEHMVYQRKRDTLYCGNMFRETILWSTSAGQCFKDGFEDATPLEVIEL